MKLFFSNDYKVIKSNNHGDNLYIVYSPYSNSVIKFNQDALGIFLDIIKNGSGVEFNISNYVSEDEEVYFYNFIEMLNQNHLIFYTEVEFNEANFKEIYTNFKTFNLKKAYLHLTQRCNLSCGYCYNRYNIGKWDELTTNDWVTVLTKLKKIGITSIVFTGGECFLRDDILTLSKYVKDMNMSLHILTNGTIPLDIKIFDYVDLIEISLDSYDIDINEENRKGSYLYDIIGNLLNIPVKYRSNICIKGVLTQENEKDLENMRNFLESNHFNKLEIILRQPNNLNEVNLIPTEIIKRVPHEFNQSLVTKCNACFEIIAINSNGDIYPCQALIKPEFLISNIMEDNWIEKVRNSNITKRFMEYNINDMSKCGKCKFRYICGGGCKAVSYNVYGNLFAYQDFFCTRYVKDCIDYLETIDFKEE